MKLLGRAGCVGCGALLLLGTATAAVAVAVLLAVQGAPLVPTGEGLTGAEVREVRRLLARHDPRRLESGQAGRVEAGERELELAARYALGLVRPGGVALRLAAERLELQAAVELPAPLAGRFLNLDLTLRESEGLPRFERLRVGRLPLPARLGDALLRRPPLLPFLSADSWRAAVSMVDRVELEPGQLRASYTWHPERVRALGSELLTGGDRERVPVYWRRIEMVVAVSDPLEGLPLSILVQSLFTLAGERSPGGDPVAENRAALLVLDAYANRSALTAWIATDEHADRVPRRRVVLRGQRDLGRHFITSAAVAAVGSSALADALGLDKEMQDARDGSGFSFQDLAADRAGARFGRAAVASADSARRLQELAAAHLEDRDLLPEVADLPEALSEAEFTRLFGGTGGPEFARLSAEIDRRLDALPLYRRALS